MSEETMPEVAAPEGSVVDPVISLEETHAAEIAMLQESLADRAEQIALLKAELEAALNELAAARTVAVEAKFAVERAHADRDAAHEAAYLKLQAETRGAV